MKFLSLLLVAFLIGCELPQAPTEQKPIVEETVPEVKIEEVKPEIAPVVKPEEQPQADANGKKKHKKYEGRKIPDAK